MILLALVFGVSSYLSAEVGPANPLKKSAESVQKAISLETADLGQLFRYYGSDKDLNGYTGVYHTLFNALRDKKIDMLEIGIGTMIPGAHSSMVGFARENYKPGGSLRAWRDFFRKGTIYGFDVQPDTQFSDEQRIITKLCDSTKAADVAKTMESLGGKKFDIILDDGSHVDQSQYLTLKHFYPHLKEGGIYIIEDIYPGSAISSNPGALADYCNGDPYFFVGVKNNICVIYKNHLDRDSKKINY